jgi:LDH2 family malate/lactate/ureidoglycolate dehydrogenase
MLTFGGYKGSALAAMVELLAGPLIGDMTSAESLAWDNGAGGLPYGGELILALDPDRFLGTDAARHLARAETLFIGMQQQGARLPGERRYFLVSVRSARSEYNPFTFQGYLFSDQIIVGVINISGGIMSFLVVRFS